jgi:hypothetical protein
MDDRKPPKGTPETRPSRPRARYEKPAMRSESLTAVAAVCNGTTTASRKASTGAPSFCNSSRLKS